MIQKTARLQIRSKGFCDIIDFDNRSRDRTVLISLLGT